MASLPVYMRRDEDLIDASTRIGLDLEEVVQPLVTESRYIGLQGTFGLLDQLREQFQGGPAGALAATSTDA
jgi:hypothetical protein